MQFQSTHLHEVWLNFYILRAYFWSFNPHTYMRCDSPALTLHCWSCSFNPHTYMRCDTIDDIHKPALDGFNPHTYMRCDNSIDWKGGYYVVSIHTPTWGVTLLGRIELVRFLCFNPHTYMRCDTGNKRQTLNTSVSIHTPTWGVTNRRSAQTSIGRFQSTHLHEVWHYLPRIFC